MFRDYLANIRLWLARASCRCFGHIWEPVANYDPADPLELQCAICSKLVRTVTLERARS